MICLSPGDYTQAKFVKVRGSEQYLEGTAMLQMRTFPNLLRAKPRVLRSTQGKQRSRSRVCGYLYELVELSQNR